MLTIISESPNASLKVPYGASSTMSYSRIHLTNRSLFTHFVLKKHVKLKDWQRTRQILYKSMMGFCLLRVVPHKCLIFRPGTCVCLSLSHIYRWGYRPKKSMSYPIQREGGRPIQKHTEQSWEFLSVRKLTRQMFLRSRESHHRQFRASLSTIQGGG